MMGTLCVADRTANGNLPPPPKQMGFLPGPTARRNLNQPKQEHVDLRAACFCHRKIVDIGYVCSVCLSSESLGGPTPTPASVETWVACSLFFSRSSMGNLVLAVFCSPLPVCSTCRYVHRGKPRLHNRMLHRERSASPTSPLE